ncbi:histidine kinase [Citricoccus sp.]|uniref:sensor histidine kinase n=1 Tax=Citricoccus sp. TaxID=1978372 RepID=UPI00262F21FC|nr:histidine kinase [Citricoccus sp.]HRO30920.1 histidine kinase [Citricoccus sp.]HRO92605.1 histidine kinase [Citricoccus sp.]
MDTDADAPPAGTRIPVLLRTMRVVLHVSVAVLLLIGLIRSLAPALRTGDHGAAWLTVLLAALFAAVYLAGTIVEKRRAARADWEAADGGIAGRGRATWLLLVTVAWWALLAVHVDFAWLVFPLFFLHLHLVGRRSRPGALVLVLLLTGSVLAGFLAHRGTLDVGSVVGPVLGAVVAVVMSAAYALFLEEARIQRRTSVELRAAQDRLAASERQAGALAERERWARDLHDTLAQGLASVVLLSRAALDRDPGGPLSGRLRQIERSAAENLVQVRALVEQRGAGDDLATVLADACRAVQGTARAAGSGLTVTFRGPEDGAALGGDVATTVLRVAQSALSNVLLHSGAAHCVVTLAVHPRLVTLDVHDDGRGRGGNAEGFGIRTMRERAEGLGGTLTVEDADEGPGGAVAGRGTVVALALPLPPRPTRGGDRVRGGRDHGEEGE